jgi:hypothetical protein
VRDARSDSYTRFVLAAGPDFVVRAVLSKIERDPGTGGLLIVRPPMLSRVGGFSPPSLTDVAWG